MSQANSKFIHAIINRNAPEKRELEHTWAQRFGLNPNLVAFSHLNEEGAGVLCSGVVLCRDGETVMLGNDSQKVDDLNAMGEFLEDFYESQARRRTHGISTSPLDFVEQSALAFWNVTSSARILGEEKKDWRMLLPRIVQQIDGLTSVGSPDTGDLAFTVESVPGFTITHINGVLFAVSFEGVKIQENFYDEKTYRKVILLAASGLITKNQASLLAPPPHEVLNAALATQLGVHLDLLSGQEWSGVNAYSLSLDDVYDVVTNLKMSEFHLSRYGFLMSAITNPHDFRDFLNVQ